MASRIYFPIAVLITAIVIAVFGLVLPPHMPFTTSSARTLSDRQTNAERLLKQGIEQYKSSNYREAMRHWQKSLEIYRAVDFPKGETNTLNHIGRAYRNLGEYKLALELHQQALSACKQIGARKSKFNTFNTFSRFYNKLISSQLVLAYHQQTDDFKQQIDHLGCEAISLNNLGSIYGDLGDFKKAINLSEQALSIFKQIGDCDGEASALNSLGIAYDYSGKYQQAIKYYRESLEIFKRSQNLSNEAKLLNNMALTYRNLSQYKEAISFSQLSLKISKEIQNIQGEANSLGAQGFIYRTLGQYQRSIELSQRSLTIFRQVGDRQSEGLALNGLGLAYRNLNKFEIAIDFYLQALSIFRQIEDSQSEANSLNNIGNAYNILGQYQKSIEFFKLSLSIKQKINDLQGQARSLNALGTAYQNLDRYPIAFEFYQKALRLFNQIGERESEAKALNNFGFATSKFNQPDLAILLYKQSVNIRESIRKEIKELGKEEQKSYLATISTDYKNLADLLLNQRRVTEALQVLDLLKIQELEDYLKNVKGNDRTAQGIQLLAPEQAISSQLSTISYDRLPELNRQLASQIQQLPKSAVNKVPAYLQNLPQGAILIYPLILDDRLELIVFSANALPINRTVAIEKAKLEKLVKDFRSDMQDPTSQDVKNSSKKLYDILIKPIEADLKQANVTTILYAPDGILRYIPLAALYDGKQWLVEQYRINNLIAYSLFDSSPKLSNNLRILAGAFGDEPRAGFSALPATIPEVNYISTSFSNTTKQIGRNFTATSIKANVANQTIVHLATHAEFNSDSPLNSFVLFGDGSKVTLAEINEWQLKDTDLVILSACRTGVGSLGNGAEILGFGYQVQRAGAKASIASLWIVSDGGTQKLMEAFYENLRTGSTSMSTSLREAQLNMIRKPIKQGEINFNHPYFWSAFVLIGNGL